MPKKYLTEHVPFSLAIRLKSAGYWNPGGDIETIYTGPCFLKDTRKYCPQGAFCIWENILPAPSYAEVIDWLIEKDIYVEAQFHMSPLWQGFIWKRNDVISYILDKTNPGSWSKVMNTAIRRALAEL